MTARITIVLVLLLSMGTVPLRAAAPSCAMRMVAVQKMECTKCCATVKSCALPQRNPTESTAPSTPDQQPVAVITPALPMLVSDVWTTQVVTLQRITPSLAQTVPRRALLCTFLI